jgi:hypothetical protein
MDNGVVDRLYGNYRAEVIDNKDREKFGRVKVWIPDLMPDVNKQKGLWARPANNPVGGRNQEGDSEHHYMGSCYIPKKGAWVWVFFEAGNINRPYYFGALDLENTPVLPENQLGSNPEDKWTIFKSHKGRTIIISDDPSDRRVEITGRKINLNTPPTGDTDSVYEIDANQNVILLDERQGKEKLLIRTYKGDFIHIDIDEQKLQMYFKDDIIIKTDGTLYLEAKEDMNIRSRTGDIKVEASSQDVDIKAANDLHLTAGSKLYGLAGTDANIQAFYNINLLAGVNINQDAGTIVNEQAGDADPSEQGVSPDPADPKGERST